MGTTARPTPRAASIALATFGTVQPAALEVLWAVDPLILLSTYYRRASVASETLTGVTQSKIGDVSLFIYLFVYMYGRTQGIFVL